MFSCEYCQIFRNTYFEEHLRMAASAVFQTDKTSTVSQNLPDQTLLLTVPDSNNHFFRKKNHKKFQQKCFICCCSRKVFNNYLFFPHILCIYYAILISDTLHVKKVILVQGCNDSKSRLRTVTLLSDTQTNLIFYSDNLNCISEFQNM